MAAKKKTAKRGTKRAARGTANPETFKVPRTAGQLAAGIWAREQRTPGYWAAVQEAMATWQNSARATHRDSSTEAMH